MPTPIQTKVQQLQHAGFDLGNQITNETDCGYGGRQQQFSNATIYYHAVMGNAAHEVHGGIRTKYLSLGGHEINPATGNRPLGFPLTDEMDSKNYRCRVSRFEWGAIYWTHGGVVVYGDIYKKYQQLGEEKSIMGYPIADPVLLPQGMVSFFEYGLLYVGDKSHGQVLEMRFQFPLLGHPWMINAGQFPDNDVIRFNFFRALINPNIAGHLLETLFNGRIFLKETAGTAEIPISFDFTKVKEVASLPDVHTYSSPMQLGGQVKNKQLYDIILKFPNRTHIIAPHAIYFREQWNDFRFAHITDTHISRRVDGFRKFFRDKTMEDAVRNFNNFNDNFREFIQYANRMHRAGNLDFIMLTGDVVDYCFEAGRGYHQDNFVYFENIVRGLTGKPDQVDNQELTVPILTSLGNHDYRVDPYYPLFTIDIPAASDKTMEQYSSMNLTKSEADITTRQHLGLPGAKVDRDQAYAMIAPDRDNNKGNLDHYFRHICRETSYTVELGEHQVIMIDGKWDAEPLESDTDVILYKLGRKGEATDNFASGSPDAEGFNGQELSMVSRALQKNGLVIIGMHAPVINPKHNDFSWFLREYVRSANPAPYANEMRKYLFRIDPNAFATSSTGAIDLTRNVHPGWSRTNSFWFHEGNGGDLLDYGVMRNGQLNFLKMITGVENSPRAADLVLSGHVHKNWECRCIWDAGSQKLRFSHEFFTENPEQYYHSYDTNIKPDGPVNIPGLLADEYAAAQKRILHVELSENAAVNEQPELRSSNVWYIKAKPYPYTLHAQPNIAHAKQWWLNLRPLLVQTAALGPSEWLRSPERQPDFRGCRMMAVDGGAITKIHYVTHDAIQKELSNTHPTGDDHAPLRDVRDAGVFRG
ncbi:metallophosphoesterase [Flavihumibacter stibioxidans]|uniref:Calcineurin-like phosphoesterase domain-containing protein n=1 Tax=Flavihumibacter stibioxidans TaxID=1834163 RepID=A0ABR7M9B3_9BACT|nr:metallophosphoesterase [Flavihumibacter stibioxidans]MBC6491537.1 hypothetical protein [Flavihumibacter stibioxidans]